VREKRKSGERDPAASSIGCTVLGKGKKMKAGFALVDTRQNRGRKRKGGKKEYAPSPAQLTQKPDQGGPIYVSAEEGGKGEILRSEDRTKKLGWSEGLGRITPALERVRREQEERSIGARKFTGDPLRRGEKVHHAQ